MSMRRSGQDDHEPMVELNVTPLVDVMLVLLVIFIVTAPLIVPRAIKIDLPKTGAAPREEIQGQHVLLIQADGRMYYKNQLVTEDELIAQWQSDKAKRPVQLQVHADESVSYGQISKLMALAQSVGITNLAFMTLPAPKNN